MSAYVELGVPKDQLAEFLVLEEPGINQLTLRNTGEVAILAAFYRKESNAMVKSPLDTQVSDEPVFDGDALAETPVVPGSIVLAAAGLPTLVDSGQDGIFRIQDRVVGETLVSGVDGVTSIPATRTLTSAAGGFDGVVFPGDSVVISEGLDKGIYTVVTVNSDTVLLLDANFAAGSLTALSFEVYAADLQLGTVDYFTGTLNLNYPSGSSPDAKGSVVGTLVPPWNLDPGDILTVDIDGGGAANATFAAAQATLAGSGGTFAAMAAETFEVQFEDGEVQLVTFGTEATLQLAVDLINATIVGGEARINGTDVDLVSDHYGTDSRVRTTNVAAGVTTKLGIADAGDEQDATSDAANINAVTFAEAKAIIEADVSDSLATLDETGYLRISSASSNVGSASIVQCGGVNAKFGLDALAHAGDDEGAFQDVLADYIQTVQVAAEATQTYRMPVANSSQVSMKLIASGAPSKARLELAKSRV